MRKKVGVIKRVLCIVLIFLLSINSFASIISDNDGSAFITKSEFDALKSSFQAQIDSYNQSIDAKIDGAIASYLSGIKLSTQETIMPKNNQLNYKAMTSVNLVEGFCGLNVATANLVSGTRQQDKLSNECGACAYIVLQVKSTPAYGFIANSDNSNNVFLIGEPVHKLTNQC